MMKRREFITSTSAAALGTLAAPSLSLAQGGTLKVGTYGGYFEESFKKHIYPDFTAATGIEVDSIAEPTGEAWLVQLQQAARAGQAPADVSMMAQVPRIRGERAGLWAKLDRGAMPNVENLPDHFIHGYDGDGFYGTGAVAWYISLVTNTNVYPAPPESWKTFWDPANENRLGLLALASNSFLLEITGHCFFGGTDILATEEGVLEVMNKLAEVKPNVRLWYRDEGQFQQALETGEIPMGQYYHDVTGLAAADGKPVRSTFPTEGAVLDAGSWVVSKASDAIEASQVFIDYMSQPEIQSKLSRFVGTAPTIPRSMTDLTDEEFAAVSSEVPPILPRYELYVDKADWVNQKWSELVTG
ncbi:ABC transporter substrate-binding protein [Roseovarius sp. SYSU LYC5161]|uniref:ABC transporter substrate-binding protein n=1 Tax=Roseovarius halophilus (ex Wu et al. 2025) TaxID=3376060 RepID=UPI0028716F90|nr:extracellular solute-binding protein [Roseovarius sp.]